MKAFVFALFVFVFGSCVQAAPADWKALHERADAVPLAQLRAAARAQPDSIEALYALALGHMNLYEEEAARSLFQEILRRDPDNIGGRWGLAELMRRDHRLDAAQEELEKIMEEAPEFAAAPVTLGYLLFDKDEYERSIRLAVRVIRLGADRVDLTNLTRAYLIIGGAKGMLAEQGGPFSKLFQGTQVMSYLRKAQRLQPENPGVYFGMGSFYAMAPAFAGGDKAKGIKLLEKAVETDPNFTDAWARLAGVWFAHGDKEKYKRYLAKARSLDPRNKLVLKVEKFDKGEL